VLNQIPDLMEFDMLTGPGTPMTEFGDLEQDFVGFESLLIEKAEKARQSVRSTFGVKMESSSSIPWELDDIVLEMWETGWDPRVGNLNYFTVTFGLILIDATLELLGGRPIFRPPVDNTDFHTSIFWPTVEAFPYHKAFKCLTLSDGEMMSQFVCGVAGALEEKGLLRSETKARLPKRPDWVDRRVPDRPGSGLVR
jgi:hypothetical protein